MREKRYTAGPWFIRPRPTDDGLAVIEDGRSDGLHPITCEWSEAPIVSAAPDLLEALEAILPNAGWANMSNDELLREHSLGNEAAQKILNARAALAKAYGESE